MFSVVTTIFVFTIERFRAIRDPFFTLVQGGSVSRLHCSVLTLSAIWVTILTYSILQMLVVFNLNYEGQLSHNEQNVEFCAILTKVWRHEKCQLGFDS